MPPALRVAIFDPSLSTHTTALPVSARHAPNTSPTYPVPTTAIFIFLFARGPTPTPDALRGVDRSRVSRTGRRCGRRHCDIRDRGSSHEETQAEYHNKILSRKDF